MRKIMMCLCFVLVANVSFASDCESDCERGIVSRAELIVQPGMLDEVVFESGGSALVLVSRCGSGRPLFDVSLLACKSDNCFEFARINRVLIEADQPLEVNYVAEERKLTLHTDVDVVSFWVPKSDQGPTGGPAETHRKSETEPGQTEKLKPRHETENVKPKNETGRHRN